MIIVLQASSVIFIQINLTPCKSFVIPSNEAGTYANDLLYELCKWSSI
jgi:hypothetical protein